MSDQEPNDYAKEMFQMLIEHAQRPVDSLGRVTGSAKRVGVVLARCRSIKCMRPHPIIVCVEAGDDGAVHMYPIAELFDYVGEYDARFHKPLGTIDPEDVARDAAAQLDAIFKNKKI